MFDAVGSIALDLSATGDGREHLAQNDRLSKGFGTDAHHVISLDGTEWQCPNQTAQQQDASHHDVAFRELGARWAVIKRVTNSSAGC